MNDDPEWRAEYERYLHSPQWKQRRAMAMERAQHRCQRCQFSRHTVRLEVHHLTYAHFGNELPEELVVLCPKCHEEADAEREEATAKKRRLQEDEFERSRFEARVTGWARKRYGEEFEFMDYGDLCEEFGRWLEVRGEA